MNGAGLVVFLGAMTAAEADSSALPLYRVEPQRVTAPAFPMERPTLSARTLFDRDDLRRRDAADLSRMLAPAAGLRLVTGADGMGVYASLRGLGPDRVAILVDGRPIGAAQGGAVDLRAVDPEGLERIEVLRGAVGAIHGPGALGGAINLVRRRDRASHLSLRALGGTGERALVRGRGALLRGRWDGEAVVDAETQAPRLGPLRSEARTAGARARLAHRPRWAGLVEVAAERRDDRRTLPGSPAFPTGGARLVDRITDASSAIRGAVMGGGTLDLDVARRGQDRRYDEPDAAFGAVHDRHVNTAWRGTAGWRSDAAAGPVASARLEAAEERLESTTDGSRRRARGALAAGLDREGEWWGWAGTVRADVLEAHGAHASGRAAVSRRLITGDSGRALRARLGGGTSFRAPTFDDLFWPARATAAGNPDLAPERALDLDLGLDGAGPAGRAEITLFASRVERLIQWIPGADGVWRPHNVGEVRILGVEVGAEASFALGAVPARAALSYAGLDARDVSGDPVTGGRRLVARAPHRVFGEVEVELGAWRAGLACDAVGPAPLTANNSKWTAGHAVWSGHVKWQAAPALRLDLEGRNLFDAPYEDVRGYPVPGREILAGFRYTPRGEP